ncbi:MAG TPA: DNA-formamidopyrimidine glycosylase [candidate division Zixibacteria bacterium]|nr:DNA-formamidopyrimidine glycosylase [candidate division Zixibacteria bacterium]
MPELPDVEVFRKYLNRTALNRKIEKVEVRDKDVLGAHSARSLQMKLKGRKFKETERRGKYMFVRFEKNAWLVLHFGMTGFLKYYKNEDQEPDHARVIFNFANGYKLAYDNQRKLGKVDIAKGLEDFAAENDIGPDVLKDDFDLGKFKEIMDKKRGLVKSALMDQKSMAGIGNIYSDEILFRAGIHPASRTEKLGNKEVKKIFKALKTVLNKAVEAEVDPQKMPRSYLLPNREAGRKCPQCKGKIESRKFSGRTGYFCNRHQKKIS